MGHSHGTPKKDLVSDYLDSGRFSELPTKTLARRIMADESIKGHIYNLESLRRAISYLRGHDGERHRSQIDGKYITKPFEGRDRWLQGMNEGLNEWEEPFELSPKRKKRLIIADHHVPFHDKEIMKRTLDYGFKNGMDGILILGDLWDFYQCSRFSKVPDKARLQEDLEIIKNFFASLRANFPTIEIIWKFGNHEARFDKYLWTNGPDIFPIIKDICTIENIVGCKSYGVQIVGYNRAIRYRELGLFHGHELEMKSININPARTAFLKSHDIVIVAHLHFPSNHNEKNVRGVVLSTWSIGCQCNLNPEYRPFNKWINGFAGLNIYDNGTWEIDNKKIIGGKVLNV